jgi:tRNA 5-methylaminomethyl-2-thiouridine biosynthesis bifunctional protein
VTFESAWHTHPSGCVLQAPFDPLAFIQLWAAWQAAADRPRILHVVAHCEYAPELADISSALHACSSDAALQALAQQLIDQWWGLLPGQHRLRFENAQVCLTLHIGQAAIDMANTAHSLYSNAPQQVASNNSQHPTSTDTLATNNANPSVIVIGAGIAGAATARALALRGWRVQVLDAGDSPASGASGLPVGLVAPHTSPDDSIISRLSRAGVRAMHQTMQSLLTVGVDWSPSGVQERRLPGKTRKGGAPQHWSTEYKTAGDAWTRPASPAAPTNALWHEKGAWLRPAKLVEALLDHPNIIWQGGASVSALAHAQGQWQALHNDRVLAQAARVVIACGPASRGLIQQVTQQTWPINPLRGQVSWGLMQDIADVPLPDSPVNGNGSFVHHIPTSKGPAWFAGSTFDRVNATTEVFTTDHQENFQRLQALLPDTAKGLRSVFEHSVRGWAGVRCSVPDRLPVVGPVDQAPAGLWVNTAMGSRGLTLAVLCGELLAAHWHHEPLPVEPQLAQALNAQRYQR